MVGFLGLIVVGAGGAASRRRTSIPASRRACWRGGAAACAYFGGEAPAHRGLVCGAFLLVAMVASRRGVRCCSVSRTSMRKPSAEFWSVDGPRVARDDGVRVRGGAHRVGRRAARRPASCSRRSSRRGSWNRCCLRPPSAWRQHFRDQRRGEVAAAAARSSCCPRAVRRCSRQATRPPLPGYRWRDRCLSCSACWWRCAWDLRSRRARGRMWRRRWLTDGRRVVRSSSERSGWRAGVGASARQRA